MLLEVLETSVLVQVHASQTPHSVELKHRHQPCRLPPREPPPAPLTPPPHPLNPRAPSVLSPR